MSYHKHSSHHRHPVRKPVPAVESIPPDKLKDIAQKMYDTLENDILTPWAARMGASIGNVQPSGDQQSSALAWTALLGGSALAIISICFAPLAAGAVLLGTGLGGASQAYADNPAPSISQGNITDIKNDILTVCGQIRLNLSEQAHLIVSKAINTMIFISVIESIKLDDPKEQKKSLWNQVFKGKYKGDYVFDLMGREATSNAQSIFDLGQKYANDYTALLISRGTFDFLNASSALSYFTPSTPKILKNLPPFNKYLEQQGFYSTVKSKMAI